MSGFLCKSPPFNARVKMQVDVNIKAMCILVPNVFYFGNPFPLV